jgi:alanine racemase
MRFRSTRAVIHLDHLAHNVSELRRSLGSPSIFFCPMVKANGYGHGDVEIAKKLVAEGVEHLGVGLIEEGILLREMGVKGDLIFFGTFDESGAKAVVEYSLTPVLSTWDQLKALESTVRTIYPVHVKFDTGMHRLGFSMNDVAKLSQYFQASNKLQLKGILTHLHTGEDADNIDGTSFEQLRKFQQVERTFQYLKPVSHTLNSAGMLNFLKHQGRTLPHGISTGQGVRPGLAIYGLAPVETDLKLKPVMSLRSETVKYHLIKAGDGVSYNHTWKASQDSVIAVVPMGYADGYHRLLSNRGEVLFRGQRAPVVGNVCMDYFMINITPILKSQEVVESLKPESVTLFGSDETGKELSAFEVAKKAQTISWEILTSVGERVPREVEA